MSKLKAQQQQITRMGQVVCKAYTLGKCNNVYPCPNGAHVSAAVYEEIKNHQEAFKTSQKEKTKSAAAKTEAAPKAKAKAKAKKAA